MAACPKHRPSKMTQRKRRGNYRLATLALTKCPQCFEIKLAHRVCKSCGYYNKKVKVLEIQKQ